MQRGNHALILSTKLPGADTLRPQSSRQEGEEPLNDLGRQSRRESEMNGIRNEAIVRPQLSPPSYVGRQAVFTALVPPPQELRRAPHGRRNLPRYRLPAGLAPTPALRRVFSVRAAPREENRLPPRRWYLYACLGRRPRSSSLELFRRLFQGSKGTLRVTMGRKDRYRATETCCC